MAEPTTAPTAPTSQLVLHHLENSRSQRILWLLEELEVPYELKIYKRTPELFAPKELYDVHPLGKSPVLTDGPLTLAESGAIVEYLISRYGKSKFGVDESSDAWVDNLYWTHYSEGSLQPLLTRYYVYHIIPSRVPFFIRPIARALFGKVLSMTIEPELEKHGKMLEAKLKEVESKGGAGWLVGLDHPTSADFVLSFTIEVFVWRVPQYCGDQMKEYVKKMHERPAYKRVLEKGGEYLLASKD